MNDWMNSRESDHGSLAVVVVIAIIILTILAGIGLSHQPPARPGIDVAQFKSDFSNSPRFIAMHLERIVDHIDVEGSYFTVVAGSGFSRLDFEDQASAMKLISTIAGSERGGDDFEIHDLATGRRIASWNSTDGLKLASR